MSILASTMQTCPLSAGMPHNPARRLQALECLRSSACVSCSYRLCVRLYAIHCLFVFCRTSIALYLCRKFSWDAWNIDTDQPGVKGTYSYQSWCHLHMFECFIGLYPHFLFVPLYSFLDFNSYMYVLIFQVQAPVHLPSSTLHARASTASLRTSLCSFKS